MIIKTEEKEYVLKGLDLSGDGKHIHLQCVHLHAQVCS
jgi:hypothetical protein